MLSNKTTTVVAQITHVWINYKKGWRCVRCKYNVRGKEYKQKETITREEYDYLNVGDCIEIKVSLVDNEVETYLRMEIDNIFYYQFTHILLEDTNVPQAISRLCKEKE